jgi:hypothetical protein
MPVLEREYRQDLYNVQKEAADIIEWNTEELPVRIRASKLHCTDYSRFHRA